MGINACILKWFNDLADLGVFSGQNSVLELGPQDIFFSPETLLPIAIQRLGADRGASCVKSIYDGLTNFRVQREQFYSIFGLNEYKSTDSYDKRADFYQDLNVAESAPNKFDIVVDCGTTEHVFNAGNVFSFTHNSLGVGGISLKVLPAFGDNTHGFYNIHPTVYFDVARVNDYEIIDFRYIDNMSARSESRGSETLISSKDFMIGLTSFLGCASLQEKISATFLASLCQARDEGRTAQPHSTVDYCFVAMKKMGNADFQYPGQGVYLNEFSE